jgi:hypothetical protein
LADGAEALQSRLQDAPRDDQARFGLGVLQFLQTFEHLGGSLYQYGLRTEQSFLRPPPQFRGLLPQNPTPRALTYDDARQIVQTFLDDLAKVEATLAQVDDGEVKLPLPVGLIQIDPFGQGRPIHAAFLLGQLDGLPPEAAEQARTLVIGFDRGDVNWLRGYCHFLAACGELLLAVDGQRAFDCSAHLFFAQAETPHAFLIEDGSDFRDGFFWENRGYLSDVLSFVHQLLRLPIKEPERTKAALAHLEAGVAQAKLMWEFILREEDDDHEWIPNPRQTGVVGVQVTQEIIDVWRETLDEVQQVLQGAKLIPFWRGTVGVRGVNFRRVFLELEEFDLIEWIQGTAAAPYLEQGELTGLADPAMGRRLNDAFGGPFNFIGFGLWFN